MPDNQKQTGGSTTSVTAPGMTDILGAAKYLFNSGSAWAPNKTSQVTPFSTQTKNALSGLQWNANASVDPTRQNFDRVSATLSDGGLNPLQQGQVDRLQGIAGGNGLNEQQQSGSDLLKRIAEGGDRNGNPYLDQIIKQGSGDIANADNLMASVNGRYGSGSHQNILEKNIGDFATGQRFQDYNNQQNRQDSAIRDYFGMGTTGFGQRADAIGSLYNAGGQQRANVLSGTGQLQDAMDLRNQPYQQLGQVGRAFEDKNREVLGDQNRIFKEGQSAMTDPINWLASLAGGYAGSTTTQSTASNPLLNLLGGAAKGYDIFGGPIGGAFGGLAGAFS